MSKALTAEQKEQRRREQREARQAEKQSRSDRSWHAAFLLILTSTGGNVSKACRDVGIKRRLAYAHYDLHPDFAEAWDDALADRLDRLKEQAFTLALAGNVLLLMFLIKQADPSYRDNYQAPPKADERADLTPTPDEQAEAAKELHTWREERTSEAASYAAQLSSLVNAQPMRPTSPTTMES